MRASSFVFVLLLSGCATGYHAANYDGGYGEVRLAANAFRVTFAGNVASTQAATDRMVLLRSAEVARAHGFPFFIASGAGATGTAMTIASTIVTVPASTMTIVCYGRRPDTSLVVHDADALIATLGAQTARR